jgi:2-polyprenyl-3-methyl-5-hydroxy-6-metoxy-1,4-benzoquinol methylase
MSSLEQLIAGEKWFHAIDFGDGRVSPGRFGPGTPPNYTLFGVFEWLRALALEGTRAVDVGTMDGLVAFVMKALGARQVIATDLAPRATFEAARAALGLDIDYRVPLPVLELPAALAADRADVVVMAGVLYHVFDPLAVLVACREALRRDGFLIVETMYLFDEGQARMSFSPADTSGRGVETANVFWRPSKRALEGMLQLTGFEVIGSIAVDGRIATLAQARRPSEISTRARIQRVHQRYMKYANYRERVDFEALEKDTGEPSRARLVGKPGDRRIYPALYQPSVPFQPAWAAPDPRSRARHAARSAWFHARATLATARAELSDRLRHGG